MSGQLPRDGRRFYWCPHCRREHMRNSTIGNLHKAYVNMGGPSKVR